MKKIYISFCCMFLFMLTSFSVFAQDDRFIIGVVPSSLSPNQKKWVENHEINFGNSILFFSKSDSYLYYGYGVSINQYPSTNIVYVTGDFTQIYPSGSFSDKKNLTFALGNSDGVNDNYYILHLNFDNPYISQFNICDLNYFALSFCDVPPPVVKPSYTISTSSNPNIGGTVSGGGYYLQDTNITLTAIPNQGYKFVGWDDGIKDNPRNITVTSNRFYVAYFDKVITYTLNVSSNNLNYGTVSGGGTYESNQTTIIKANAKYGYKFVRWSDGNTSNPRQVTVSSNLDLTAIFEKEKYTLTLNSEPYNGGSVSGGGTYDYLTDVNISAKPNKGYKFVRWSDGNTSSSRTISVNSNINLTAIFEKLPEPITPNVPIPNIKDNFKPNAQDNLIVNNGISSNLKGSSINIYRNDYYDVYLVPKVLIKQNGNDYVVTNSYSGQFDTSISGSNYVIPVYKYTEVQFFGPNLVIANDGFMFENYVVAQSEDPEMARAIIATSKGLIQKDVSNFKFNYVDEELLNKFNYSQLPLKQSETDRSVVHVGEHVASTYDMGSTYVGSYEVNIESFNVFLNIAVCDTSSTVHNIIIQNNLNSNFNNMDNLLQNGNATSQGANSSLGNVNNNLDSTITDFDKIENQFNESLQNNASQIKPNDFLLNSQKILNAMKFVSTNFTNLITDSSGHNPFGAILGFGLMLGLALLIIGKRTR